MLRCDWLADVNNNMESEWIHDEVIQLIHLYESSELLWLPSCAHYKDKDKKRAKETEIAAQLQKTGSYMERNGQCMQFFLHGRS